jgi:hypothetical protein
MSERPESSRKRPQWDGLVCLALAALGAYLFFRAYNTPAGAMFPMYSRGGGRSEVPAPLAMAFFAALIGASLYAAFRSFRKRV